VVAGLVSLSFNGCYWGIVLELNQRLNTFTTAALQVADLTSANLTCCQLATSLAPHRSKFLGCGLISCVYGVGLWLILDCGLWMVLMVSFKW